GRREMSGEHVEEGRAALSHWAGLPHFQDDWRIWQGLNARSREFGNAPILMFHRGAIENFRFCEAAADSFDELKTAPYPHDEDLHDDPGDIAVHLNQPAFRRRSAEDKARVERCDGTNRRRWCPANPGSENQASLSTSLKRG